jgi:hypothetical protein
MEGIMANKDIVQGCLPYGPVLRVRPYTAGGTIYKGDPVKLDGAGKVVVATAGDACAGVAAEYAVADAEVKVYDHPDQEFECQSDSADIDALADMNLNYQFVFGTASTLYKRSGVEIDGDTGATNSNYQAKVLRMKPAVGNALGANVVVILKLNNHQLSAGTGTLGV